MKANCQLLPKTKLGIAARNHQALQTTGGGKAGLLPPGAKLARQEQEKPTGMTEGAGAAGASPLQGKRPEGSCGTLEPLGPK